MAKAVRAADGKCWKYVGLYNYIDIDMRSPYIMIHIVKLHAMNLGFILWHTFLFHHLTWKLHVSETRPSWNSLPFPADGSRVGIYPKWLRWLLWKELIALWQLSTSCGLAWRLDLSCRLCIGSGAGFLRLAEPKLDLGSWTTFLWIPSTLVRPSSPTFRSWNSKVWSHNHECFSIADFCWSEP